MHIRSLSTLVWIKNIQTLPKVFLIHSTVSSLSVFQQDSSHKEGLKKYTAGIIVLGAIYLDDGGLGGASGK